MTQKNTNINTKNLGTVNGPSETKPNQVNCKSCSSKCAYDCAQLQNTIQHRTVLISPFLPPDNHHSSDVVYRRKSGWFRVRVSVYGYCWLGLGWSVWHQPQRLPVVFLYTPSVSRSSVLHRVRMTLVLGIEYCMILAISASINTCTILSLYSHVNMILVSCDGL